MHSFIVCIFIVHMCMWCQSAHGGAVEWLGLNINQVTEQAWVSFQTSPEDCVMPTPTWLVFMYVCMCIHACPYKHTHIHTNTQHFLLGEFHTKDCICQSAFRLSTWVDCRCCSWRDFAHSFNWIWTNALHSCWISLVKLFCFVFSERIFGNKVINLPHHLLNCYPLLC